MKLFNMTLAFCLFAFSLQVKALHLSVEDSGDIPETQFIDIIDEHPTSQIIHVRTLITDAATLGTLAVILRWTDERGPQSRTITVPVTALNQFSEEVVFLHRTVESPVTYEIDLNNVLGTTAYRVTLNWTGF